MIFCYKWFKGKFESVDCLLHKNIVKHDFFFIILHFILWETGHSTFCERSSLGIGQLILFEPDHLSSGNWTTYPPGFETSSGKRDMGNETRYPLGFGPLILWETSSWNREFGRWGATLQKTKHWRQICFTPFIQERYSYTLKGILLWSIIDLFFQYLYNKQLFVPGNIENCFLFAIWVISLCIHGNESSL